MDRGNSTILPGVTIGKHAIVAAGSVVTRCAAEYDRRRQSSRVIREIQPADKEHWETAAQLYHQNEQTGRSSKITKQRRRHDFTDYHVHSDYSDDSWYLMEDVVKDAIN